VNYSPDAEEGLYSLGFAKSCRDQVPNLGTYVAGRNPGATVDVVWVSRFDRQHHRYLTVELIQMPVQQLMPAHSSE
jgi:hypothetical protein